MTTLSASITRTDGLPMEGRVEVSSAYYRAGTSAVITSDPVVVEMTGGSFRVDVEPGPTRVRIIAPHSSHCFNVTVPDGMDADFLRLVEEETVWEPAVVDRTRTLAEQAAKAKAGQAVAQVVDNSTWDIGEERFGNKYVKTSREGYIFVYGEPDNSRALVPKSYVDKKASQEHTHKSADITDAVDAQAQSQSSTYSRRLVRLDNSGNLCAKTPTTSYSVATKGYVDAQVAGASARDSGWYDITGGRYTSGATGSVYARRVGDNVTLYFKDFSYPHSVSKAILFSSLALRGFTPLADYVGVFPTRAYSTSAPDSVHWYFTKDSNGRYLSIWSIPKSTPLTGAISWTAEPGWPTGGKPFAGTHVGASLP
ncbi:hypothetical protein [Corynebacterium mastitidis]|uniref:hypothetical protein n=1 Tax=Corynebacterium mastitidis TaxID=161890 RepID=UPI00254F1EF4|nr:hypothetical protein [Corynebacterium mastitidis]MDK8450999.1 hypothetical protein [Corynebacterium mastitidis]